MGSTVIQRSFAAGELAPSLHARADLAKYLSGLRTCRNWVVQRHGGVATRAGFQYVATAKANGLPALYPFVFAAADASYIIEAGDQYFRFHRKGSPVTVSSATAWSGATAYVGGDLASRLGVIYWCKLAHTNQQPPNATYWYPLPVENGVSVLEIPHGFGSGVFFDPARASVEQTGLRVTISHLNGAPLELELRNLTQPPLFALSTVATGPSLAPPANPIGSAGAVGARELRYVVTALKAETYEESNPSTVVVITSAADPTVAAPHVISWDAVAGAAEYRVYADPFNNGTFGFLGVATGQTSFRDVAQVPDFSLTPPIPRVLFAATNNYPAVSTTYQQRRIFAGTHIDREQIFASQVGYRSHFGIRSPLQDDDALTWTIASNLIQPVHHLIGLQLGLVVLTNSGEWVMRGDETGTLVPKAINPRQHGYVGSNFVRPAVVGESVLFAHVNGTKLHDLRFDERVEGLSGRDLCIYAAHLFSSSSKRIVDLAYAQTPHSIVWCVREDGALCGLTFIRDEDVWGWHRHDSGGDEFKRIAVIPEDGEDYLYAVVEREINGATKRYIERLHSREFATLADAFCVDSGKTIALSPASTSVTGLSHLIQRSVVALVDGAVQGPFTVNADGSITLTTAGAKVQVGLQITADVETLDLDVNGSNIRDKRKLVTALALLLENSARGFRAGPDANTLELQRAEPHEAAGLFTGRAEINVRGTFNPDGRVLIRHTDPTPVTILGLLPHVEVGG